MSLRPAGKRFSDHRLYGVGVAIGAAAGLLQPAPAAAQTLPATTATATTAPSARPSRVQIPRFATPPVLDGRLDDPCWADAAVIDDFVQVDPIEGGTPSQRTVVRIAYDDRAIYLGVACYDTHPDRIQARQMARDGDISADEVFTFAFDTFLDRRNGYWLEFGPAGCKRDGLIQNGNQVRMEWDGIWDLKTRVVRDGPPDQTGWFAEVAIPFKTLNFAPDLDTWGFNVGRVIRHARETVRWQGINRASGVRNVGAAGTIAGLGGLQQGYGLTVVPSFASRFDLDEFGNETKPSLDVFWKVTPSVTAALTLNTDFAEAEVDTRRVNLTRFPLFFPEKRDFFLQDAGVFAFGGLNQSPIPFFSRRIGIVGGEQKDILAGLKVTGREGPASFGVLDVQMLHDDDLGDKNLAVARATWNVFDESSIGIIATHGDPTTRGDNTVGGVDFNYKTNDLPGGRILEAHAWAQLSNNDPDDGPAENDCAFGGSIAYPNDVWSWDLYAAQIGSGFRPALGFVSQTGVREYSAYLRRRFRPEGVPLVPLRTIDVAVGNYTLTDLNNRLDSMTVNVPDLDFETESGESVSAGLDYQREQFDDDFAIFRDVTVPAGDYDFWRHFVRVSTNDARPVAATLRYRGGDFYDGDRQDYLAALEFRPGPQFFGSVEGEWNDVHLPDGDFLVRIARVRADVLFSPELSWSNTVQWDNASEQLGYNSRVRWEFRPGSEAFVVFNQGFSSAGDEWRSTTSELTLKVGVTLRF